MPEMRALDVLLILRCNIFTKGWQWCWKWFQGSEQFALCLHSGLSGGVCARMNGNESCEIEIKYTKLYIRESLTRGDVVGIDKNWDWKQCRWHFRNSSDLSGDGKGVGSIAQQCNSLWGRWGDGNGVCNTEVDEEIQEAWRCLTWFRVSANPAHCRNPSRGVTTRKCETSCAGWSSMTGVLTKNEKKP